jgi:murein DD-endopeptidase / murein LD-carboxypeptidase
MHNRSKSKWVLLLLLTIASQVLSTSCSKRLHPSKSFENIESNAESRKLKAFMDGGTERTLRVGRTGSSAIIGSARKYLGVPHCMGGTTRRCMDCSGLLFTVFEEHGISFARTAEEQARYGIIISDKNQLRRGDLVFFIRTYRTDRFITHSGIYLGNNEFIHASSSRGVTITSMNDTWWRDKFIFGTRVF